MSTRWRSLLLVAALGALGCEEPDLTLPRASDVEAHYATQRRITVEMSGNVAEVTVYQPSEQLRRGGSLWAKVGPYVFLFSDATRELFVQYPGLAGVRVVTRSPSGAEVARALLARDALNALTWRRALNIAGRARRDGTEKVTLLQDLVRWGEDHTTFQYADAFVSRR